MPGAIAYIGLGSNLGDRDATIRRALALLAEDPAIVVEAVSSLRETDPVGGPADQPRYLNGAARLRTTLPPEALLERMQAVEIALGRDRSATAPRWGSRTIDLDLLLYGEEANAVVMATPRLTLPHPRMHERRFVLEPLAEVRPATAVLGP